MVAQSLGSLGLPSRPPSPKAAGHAFILSILSPVPASDPGTAHSLCRNAFWPAPSSPFPGECTLLGRVRTPVQGVCRGGGTGVHLASYSRVASCLPARGHQLRLPEAGISGHWRGDAAARLRGLQCVHIRLRADRGRQVLHHDGQAGEGPAGHHPTGTQGSGKVAQGRIRANQMGLHPLRQKDPAGCPERVATGGQDPDRKVNRKGRGHGGAARGRAALKRLEP